MRERKIKNKRGRKKGEKQWVREGERWDEGEAGWRRVNFS